MYGVPADLDLSHFIGATLTQIGLGEFQLQFHFDPEGIISAEGHWELTSPDGTIVDSALENAHRDAYRIHRILGQTAVATSIDSPRSFALRFNNDFVLTFFDDSEQYETISILPGGIYI